MLRPEAGQNLTRMPGSFKTQVASYKTQEGSPLPAKGGGGFSRDIRGWLPSIAAEAAPTFTSLSCSLWEVIDGERGFLKLPSPLAGRGSNPTRP